jgi:hypothetical protein
LRRVAAFGLADRIETRAQAVEDLTDVEQFDLAYVPQVSCPMSLPHHRPASGQACSGVCSR